MSALNFHHLRYFWTVAREGNLTRAAEQLRVSQSAVSVQIRKLEDTLGRRLFERTGRQLKLTDAGRVALDHADAIFGMGDRLLEALEAQEAVARSVLDIGVLSTLSRNFQIRFIDPIMNQSDVAVSVYSGQIVDLVKRLESHELDIVLTDVVPARDERSPWIPQPIDEQPVSLISRPGLRRERALRELLSEEPLVVPTVASSIRTGFDGLVERLGVKPRIVAQIDDMAMLRLVARSHRGVSVIPPIVVRDELASGALVEIAQLPGLVEPFFALTMPRSAPNPVLTMLLQEARQREP